MVAFWWLLFFCGVFSTKGANYGSKWQSQNGYGAGYNIQYGKGGYGAGVQYNYSNTKCQWAWVNWKWSWSCGQGGQPNEQPPPDAPPPPEQPPPEGSVTAQPPPAEPETPEKYVYDFEVRPSMLITKNPYTDMVNSMGYKTCFRDVVCNFTWTQEINNDTDILVSWKFFDNWKTSEDQPIKLCEASYSPPDTLAYNAFKLLAAATTNNVTSCPIPAGTVERSMRFPWHMELKDKIPCGECILYSLKVTLPASSTDGEPVNVVAMHFRYDLPVDDNQCIPRKEAAAKKSEN